MRCREAIRNLESFTCGEASALDRVRIQAHLDTCSSCRREFAETRVLAQLVAQIPQLDPAPEIADSLHAFVAAKTSEREACTNAAALFSDYADGSLSPVQQAFLATHVKSCAECAEELEATKLLTDAIRSIPELDDSRVLVRVPQTAHAGATRSGWLSAGARYAAVGLAACAVIAVALSFRSSQVSTLPAEPARTPIVATERQPTPESVTGTTEARVAAVSAGEVADRGPRVARRPKHSSATAALTPPVAKRAPAAAPVATKPAADDDLDLSEVAIDADAVDLVADSREPVDEYADVRAADQPAPAPAPVIKVSAPDEAAVRRAASIVVKSHSIDKWLKESKRAEVPARPDRPEVELITIRF